MSILPISITVLFALWLLWATLSDGLFPLLTLKDSRRFGLFAILAGLFSLIPLACLAGMTFTGVLHSGKVWPMAIAYFLALALLEFIVAKRQGLTKTVRGKAGLRMSYRVPVGVLVAVFFLCTIPKLFNDPVWSLAATMAVALPIGLLGRLRLLGAEYVTPEELAKK